MTINEVLIQYTAQDFNGLAKYAEINYSANEKELNYKYDKLAKLLYAFFKTSNKLKVNGLENIEELKNSPYVIIANHKSSLDPVYLNSALKDSKKIRWISKIENFNSRIYKKVMEIGQVIPLDENRKMTSYSRQRVKEVFKKNEALGIFPEGTRNKSEKLLDFHNGAAKICIENNVPYVPIALIGNAKPFKGRVTINIGRPVYLRKISADYDDYKLISIDMREQLIEVLNGNLNFFPALYER